MRKTTSNSGTGYPSRSMIKPGWIRWTWPGRRGTSNLRNRWARFRPIRHLAQLQALKQKELEIERSAIAQKQVIYKDDEKQQEILTTQLATFKQKKLTEETKAIQDAAKQQKATIQSYLAPIESAIEGSIMGIIQGTQTLKQAMQNLATSMVSSLVGAFAKIAEEWIADKLTMLLSDQDSTKKQITAQGGLIYVENVAALIPSLGPYAAPAAAAGLTAGEVAAGVAMASV